MSFKCHIRENGHVKWGQPTNSAGIAIPLTMDSYAKLLYYIQEETELCALCSKIFNYFDFLNFSYPFQIYAVESVLEFAYYLRINLNKGFLSLLKV